MEITRVNAGANCYVVSELYVGHGVPMENRRWL